MDRSLASMLELLVVFEPGTVLTPVGEGGERVNTGALIGGVCVGVVVLMLVAVILVVFIIRKWAKHSNQHRQHKLVSIKVTGSGSEINK